MFAVSLQYPSSRSKLPQNSASSTLSFVITDALTFVTPPPNSYPLTVFVNTAFTAMVAKASGELSTVISTYS